MIWWENELSLFCESEKGSVAGRRERAEGAENSHAALVMNTGVELVRNVRFSYGD